MKTSAVNWFYQVIEGKLAFAVPAFWALNSSFFCTRPIKKAFFKLQSLHCCKMKRFLIFQHFSHIAQGLSESWGIDLRNRSCILRRYGLSELKNNKEQKCTNKNLWSIKCLSYRWSINHETLKNHGYQLYKL